MKCFHNLNDYITAKYCITRCCLILHFNYIEIPVGQTLLKRCPCQG